jgi:hypothetical protein
MEIFDAVASAALLLTMTTAAPSSATISFVRLVMP